jgi:hypothetical protein
MTKESTRVVSGSPECNDFFDSNEGLRIARSWRDRRLGRLTDALFDLEVAVRGGARRLRRMADALPRRRVLVTSVEVPGRRAELDQMLSDLKRTRHDVAVRVAPFGNRGKFQNINRALEGCDLTRIDWLVVVDDDVALPPRFLDGFLALAEAAGLKLCQPAHRFRSYATFELTQRHCASSVRETGFVEIGPLTALHRDIFGTFLPFPDLRWGWGIDAYWSRLASDQGVGIGIVDATPVEHLKPVAATYGIEEAVAEARRFLAEHSVRAHRPDLLKNRKTHRF